MIILGKNNINTTKSFGNFNNAEIVNVKSLSSVDLLKYKHIVLTEPEESIDFLFSKKAKVKFPRSNSQFPMKFLIKKKEYI